jgi:stringent starvation protein B
VVAVRFGGNTPIYTIPLVPGAIWARNIGAGRFYQQAQAADEVLFLNQGAANTIYWSLEYLTLP